MSKEGANEDIKKPEAEVNTAASKIEQKSEEPQQKIGGQDLGKMARDSASIDQAEVDKITQEVRSLVISKQLDVLKNACVADAQDEEKKKKLNGLSHFDFSQYLADNKDLTTQILADPKVLDSLSKAETEGYKVLHEKFNDKFTKVEWKEGPNTDTRINEVKNKDGQILCSLTEKTVKDPQTMTMSDGTEKVVSSYRAIDFPKELSEKKGPLHLSMAVKDENGKNIEESKAVYFTAHYNKEGKLTEVSTPTPVKFNGKGDDAIGYIEKDGKIYTLPVTQGKYKEMMTEVEKNHGMNKDLSQSVEPRASDLIVTQ